MSVMRRLLPTFLKTSAPGGDCEAGASAQPQPKVDSGRRARYRSLLLFVNEFSATRLAFFVRALGSKRHGLAVFGNDHSTFGMEFAPSLLHFPRKGVGIY